MGNGLRLAAGCSVLMGIILFSVIAGGYSSFWRSQNRIETSTSFLTEDCQKRLNLLPELVEITKKSMAPSSLQAINQTAEKAGIILKQVISHKQPLEKNLIEEFEISQTKLTLALAQLFIHLQVSLDKDAVKQFSALRKKFHTAQDNLFVAWKRYNKEVKYFNTRTTVFPGFLIAKLFGFNKIKYTGISKEGFLPAQKIFMQGT